MAGQGGVSVSGLTGFRRCEYEMLVDKKKVVSFVFLFVLSSVSGGLFFLPF